MKTIAVKGASEELRSRLEASAARNHRSLNQEALARLEMSFVVEDAARSKTHQAWVDEALAGEFKPGSAARLRQIAAKARAVAT
jgi:plasmid stability protein